MSKQICVLKVQVSKNDIANYDCVIRYRDMIVKTIPECSLEFLTYGVGCVIKDIEEKEANRGYNRLLELTKKDLYSAKEAFTRAKRQLESPFRGKDIDAMQELVDSCREWILSAGAAMAVLNRMEVNQ